jgi:fatty-acyl-CoA synthase
VVARPGAEVDPGALREWCGPRLAPFKVPKAIELVAVLPRTTSGKLLRGRLR